MSQTEWNLRHSRSVHADAVMTLNGLDLGGLTLSNASNEYMTALLSNEEHKNYCDTLEKSLFAIEVGDVTVFSTFPCEQKGVNIMV